MNEINIPTTNKNLLDPDIGRQINKEIEYLDNSGYRVIGIALNERTLSYLKEKGTCGFKNVYGKGIKTIIDNRLLDRQIEVYRGKRNKATEYVPYKMEKGEDTYDIK